jgi:hypothetical protein
MATERNNEGIKERPRKHENRAGRKRERKQTRTERLKGRVERTGCVRKRNVGDGALKQARSFVRSGGVAVYIFTKYGSDDIGGGGGGGGGDWYRNVKLQG